MEHLFGLEYRKDRGNLKEFLLNKHGDTSKPKLMHAITLIYIFSDLGGTEPICSILYFKLMTNQFFCKA